MNLLHRAARMAAAAGLAMALVLPLAGCSALRAQNPSGALRPVNAVADGDAPRVMLRGHDVVSYFTAGRHQAGSAQFQSQYEDVTFRFASAEHKAMFDKEPARYLPQFGGYCTNGIVYGIPWGGDADTWLMIDGKLYIFGGEASRDAFELDRGGNLALAQKYWAEEVKGSNSFWQRSKRLVFRVPHYRTGAELAQAVKDAKAKKP